MNISVFSHEGTDIEVSILKGQLAYTFERGGERYGNAVKLTGKRQQDLVNSAFILFINYLETKKKLDENKGLRRGAKKARR